MIISIDPFVYFFLAISLYYLFLFLVSKKDPKNRVTNSREWGYVIFIPVHNEDKVIQSTLKKALELSVRPQVIVVNDGSTDETSKILESSNDQRLHIVTRSYPNAKQGKGEALNSAYTFFLDNYNKWFSASSPDRIIITVLDADGYFDSNQFNYIAGMLETRTDL